MKQFTTKDSGKRIIFKSGMRRDIQEDKPRFDLIMPKNIKYQDSILYRWAMLMTRGAKKYGERNWELACNEEELERYKASAFRHFIQWLCDETDEDHLVAIMFNLTGAEYVKNKIKGGKNDERKTNKNQRI